MFGCASSTPIQKLETDPGIATVPCEALSKGGLRNEEKSLTQLVGGNARLVGEMRSLFRVVTPGIFSSVRGYGGPMVPGQRRLVRAELAVQPVEGPGRARGFPGVEPATPLALRPNAFRPLTLPTSVAATAGTSFRRVPRLKNLTKRLSDDGHGRRQI